MPVISADGIGTFANVRKKINDSKAELESLRLRTGRVGPDHRELKIVENLVELYLRQEKMWRQRSRIQWLADGDKNTNFYHLRANMRRRRNKIEKLQASNGDMVSMEALASDF